MESKTPETKAYVEFLASKDGDLCDGHCCEIAFFAGYAAALPKWVSVEERLPEPGTWVLIYLKHKREYWADEIVEANRKVSVKKQDVWCEQRLIYFENVEQWEDEGVTDWLSFPTPPTKEP